ncbi:MAG: hypothetical protein U0640_04155 [Phycisphaerales bacterium]
MFTEIGPAPGGFGSGLKAMASDGSMAIGTSQSQIRGYTWSPASGIDLLPLLAGGSQSFANDLSSDGTVVVGSCSIGVVRPVVWMQGVPQDIGTLDGFPSGTCNSVSEDGRVVVGTNSLNLSTRAWRWTQESGLENLGSLSPGWSASANGVNADGSVVTGSGSLPTGQFAIRWTAAAGMQSLGVLPGAVQSRGNAVSGDGLTIVGTSGTSFSSANAFRWTETTGMQPLPLLTGTLTSIASAVNHDGSVIVGSASFTGESKAMLWHISFGALSVRDFLVSKGINLAGWQLVSALDIASDGRALCGIGFLNGQQRGWIAIGIDFLMCDSIDFNNDGSTFDPQDIEAFLSVYSEGPCVPATATCNDIDFNNDTSIFDPQDIASFLSVYSEGPCL